MKSSVYKELYDTYYELAEIEEYFDPTEIANFNFNAGYYLAKYEDAIEPTIEDKRTLKVVKKLLKEHK
jgi:hypothetical protein